MATFYGDLVVLSVIAALASFLFLMVNLGSAIDKRMVKQALRKAGYPGWTEEEDGARNILFAAGCGVLLALSIYGIVLGGRQCAAHQKNLEAAEHAKLAPDAPYASDYSIGHSFWNEDKDGDGRTECYFKVVQKNPDGTAKEDLLFQVQHDTYNGHIKLVLKTVTARPAEQGK
jgi:hypothetical protein